MMALYKSAPTFTMDKNDFEEYRLTLMDAIKRDRMMLMANGKILVWVDEELLKFPKEEKKKKKPVMTS